MLRLLLAALLLMVAVNTAAAQTTCPDPNVPTDPGLQTALTEINRLRQNAGVAPLALNALLTKAAQLHAEDMARFSYFSHTSRDGRTPAQRILEVGYNWSSYGENIAWGQPDWLAVIRGWMNSSGHRANLLSARYRDLGLGVSNRRYVAVFASPR